MIIVLCGGYEVILRLLAGALPLVGQKMRVHSGFWNLNAPPVVVVATGIKMAVLAINMAAGIRMGVGDLWISDDLVCSLLFTVSRAEQLAESDYSRQNKGNLSDYQRLASQKGKALQPHREHSALQEPSNQQQAISLLPTTT